MKRIILLTITILLSMVLSTENASTDVDDASVYTISPNPFSIGEEVAITGGGFGKRDIYSRICFNSIDKYNCYRNYQQQIISWDDTAIRFIVPSFADDGNRRGKLIIFKTSVNQKCYTTRCYDIKSDEQIAMLSYSLKPHISKIYIDGQIAASGKAGEIITIKGEDFGTTNRIHFPSADAKIIKWTDDEITAEIPKTSKDGSFFDLWYRQYEYITIPFQTWANIPPADTEPVDTDEKSDIADINEQNEMSAEQIELAKKYNYFKLRKQIGCLNRSNIDERCIWERVNLVYAKEILEKTDINEKITQNDINWISENIGRLEARYADNCKIDEADFCSALNKLIDRGRYFLNK
jgi:hypothetical protein